jgi:gas vesicle protein
MLGAVAGVCLAPHTGARTREQLKSFFNSAQTTAKGAQDVAERVAPYVKQAANGAWDAAGFVKARVVRSSNGHAAVVTEEPGEI